MTNKPASLSLTDLEDLEKAGLIDPQKGSETESEFRNSISWRHWIITATRTLGLLFFLAGTIFFFASNWQAMSPLIRFSILQIGIVVSALFAFGKGTRSIFGQTSLLIASVLTGTLLAVYGQVYQTGADAFEVYAWWAGLILVWVIAAQSLGLWTLWITVFQTAFSLYSGQVLAPSSVPWDYSFAVLGIFNLGIVALWEYLRNKQSFGWLDQKWFLPLVLGAGLFWLSGSPVNWIFESGRKPETSAIVGTTIWVLALLAVFLFYYRRRPNVVAIGVALLVTATILILAVGRNLIDFDDSIAGWFITSILSIIIFGIAATLLTKFNQQLSETS